MVLVCLFIYFVELIKFKEKIIVVLGDNGEGNSIVLVGGDIFFLVKMGNCLGFWNRRKLYMMRKFKILLNVNVVVLVLVFVFFYVFFV